MNKKWFLILYSVLLILLVGCVGENSNSSNQETDYKISTNYKVLVSCTSYTLHMRTVNDISCVRESGILVCDSLGEPGLSPVNPATNYGIVTDYTYLVLPGQLKTHFGADCTISSFPAKFNTVVSKETYLEFKNYK